MKALVRTVTTADGVFLNVDDLALLMKDDDYLAECAAMSKIARDKGENSRACLRGILGYFVAVAAGQMRRMPPGKIKWEDE